MAENEQKPNSSDETILSEDPPTETSKQEKRQSTIIMIGACAIAITSIIVALFTVSCRRSTSSQANQPKCTSNEHQMKRLK